MTTRLRNGRFSTDLFLRSQWSEQALVLTLTEMVIQGVSTRKVTEITESLCGNEFSPSTVSDLCRRWDPVVCAWNGRSLAAVPYPFMVDALVVKVREEGRVRSRRLFLAQGVHEAGQRGKCWP